MSSFQNTLIPSTFFFPLSTNVGYFDSPEGYLNLTERIKQASLLYEKLVFESGAYKSTIWEQGNHHTWLSPENLNDETLAKMRSEFKPTGGNEFLAISGEQSGEMSLLISGPVVRRFHCEFHSTLRALNAEQLPWIEMSPCQLTSKGKEVAKKLRGTMEKTVDEVIPANNYFLKDQILKNLSQDLVLSASMEAATSIHGLYAPLLHRNIGSRPAPGFAALQVIIPNLSHLSWDKILDLRNQDCLIEFRQKLTSFEAMVREALPQGEISKIEYKSSILRVFVEELARELKEHQPSTGQVVADVALGLLMSPIPYLGTVVTTARGMANVKEASQSWTAAFFQLRN